jgi:hypothetical protein
MALLTPSYPVQFSVDYPDRSLSRVSTFFRLLLAIPILLIFFLVGEAVILSTLLMVLFRRKYPKWWFDWNLELLKFESRIDAYILLLRDEYPSTDEEQAVHLEIPYPDASQELNRWLPLVKWLLAVPHYIVLFFLIIIALIVAIISWFAILFTGRYPVSLFNFEVGVVRWGNRVYAYAFMLVTDRYPPFRLGP